MVFHVVRRRGRIAEETLIQICFLDLRRNRLRVVNLRWRGLVGE